MADRVNWAKYDESLNLRYYIQHPLSINIFLCNIYGPPRFARTHFSFGRKQLQSYIRLLDEIGLSSPDGIRALSSLSTHRFYIKNPCCYQVFKSAGLPFMPSLLFALRNWWCLLL